MTRLFRWHGEKKGNALFLSEYIEELINKNKLKDVFLKSQLIFHNFFKYFKKRIILSTL